MRVVLLIVTVVFLLAAVFAAIMSVASAADTAPPPIANEECATGDLIIPMEGWGMVNVGQTQLCGVGLRMTNIYGPDWATHQAGYEAQITALIRDRDAWRGLVVGGSVCP